MNNDARKILTNLKPSLEADKDLEISNLKKENAYLEIQLNKLRQKLNGVGQKDLISTAKSNLSNPTYDVVKVQQRNHNLKREVRGLRKHGKEAREARDKWRKLHYEKDQLIEFIQKRVIKLFGAQAWIDIMNTTDNPSCMIKDTKTFLEMHQ